MAGEGAGPAADDTRVDPAAGTPREGDTGADRARCFDIAADANGCDKHDAAAQEDGDGGQGGVEGDKARCFDFDHDGHDHNHADGNVSPTAESVAGEIQWDRPREHRPNIGGFLATFLKVAGVAGFITMWCVCPPSRDLTWNKGLWAHVAASFAMWGAFFVAWLVPGVAPLGAGLLFIPISDSLLQGIFELTLVIWPLAWFICKAAGTWGVGHCWWFWAFILALHVARKAIQHRAAPAFRETAINHSEGLKRHLLDVEANYIPKPWYMELPFAGLSLGRSCAARDMKIGVRVAIPGEDHVMDLDVWRSEAWEGWEDGHMSRAPETSSTAPFGEDDHHDPRGPAVKKPVVFFVHGGAWLFGSHRKCTQLALLRRLALEGYVVVSSSYRKTEWPTHVLDCAFALGWARDNIHRYGGDVSNGVILMGASAGGQIVSLLAGVACENTQVAKVCKQLTVVHKRVQGIKVRGLVMYYPAVDPRDESRHGVRWCGGEQMFAFYFRLCIGDREAQSPRAMRAAGLDSWMSCMPMWQLQRGFCSSYPPTYIAHGVNDGIVPVGHSAAFMKTLSSRRVNPQDFFMPVPYARHSFEKCPSPLHDIVMNTTIAWIAAVGLPARQQAHDANTETA